MEDRKHMYKDSHKSDISTQRKVRLNEQNEIRKKHRDNALQRKRFTMSTDNSDIKDYTCDDVTCLAKELMLKLSDKSLIMIQLQKAFSQGSALTEAFMRVDGAMHSLVGLLSGTDAALQLHAASCITNMAAASELNAAQIISHAAPYLITLLGSQSPLLQDQCAWAIGNLAGGVDESRKILIDQGAIHSLFILLKSSYAYVVQSATFALSNMARNLQAQKMLIEKDVLKDLILLLKYSPTKLELIMEASWLTSYLTANVEFKEKFIEEDMLDKLVSLFVSIAATSIADHVQIITPILRCIGNLLCGTPADCVNKKDFSSDFFKYLTSVIMSEYLHLQKEGLWVLSNFTAFSLICDKYLTKEMIISISHTLSSTFDIRKEGMYCLCNFASHSNEHASRILQLDAIFTQLVPLLKSPDLELVHMTLCLVEMLLRSSPQEAKDEFESRQGLDALERHEYSNNEAIRTKTTHILETYFYCEDDN